MDKRLEELLLDILLDSNILSKHEFVYNNVIQKTESIGAGASYLITFSNGKTSISFGCNYEYNNSTTISINITNHFGSIITLTDWINIKFGFGKFQCFSWSNEEDFVQKVKEMISALEEIFSEEKMSKILKGEHWEYVPFGWFGQR